MLFMHFYVQDRYGHSPPLRKSENTGRIHRMVPVREDGVSGRVSVRGRSGRVSAREDERPCTISQAGKSSS